MQPPPHARFALPLLDSLVVVHAVPIARRATRLDRTQSCGLCDPGAHPLLAVTCVIQVLIHGSAFYSRRPEFLDRGRLKQFVRAPSSARARGQTIARAVRAKLATYDRIVLSRFGRRELNPPTTVTFDVQVGQDGFIYLKGDSREFLSYLDANDLDRADLQDVLFSAEFEYATWG